MSVCKTGCTDLSLPENRPKATPLISQAGGKGGPVIQGFALTKSIHVPDGGGIAVCPGVIYSPCIDTAVSYRADTGYMSLIAGERIVVPNGKYVLYFEDAVEVRIASQGFSPFLIEEFTTPAPVFDFSGVSYKMLATAVVLIGDNELAGIDFTVAGSKVTYQWYCNDEGHYRPNMQRAYRWFRIRKWQLLLQGFIAILRRS